MEEMENNIEENPATDFPKTEEIVVEGRRTPRTVTIRSDNLEIKARSFLKYFSQ